MLNPLESPWLLAAIGSGVLLVALLRLVPSRPKLGGLLALVGLLVAGAGWFLDDAVVTDRERLQTQLEGLVVDFAGEDVDGVLSRFAPTAIPLRLLARAAIKLVSIEEGYRLTDTSVRFTGEAANGRPDAATQHFRLNGKFSVGTFGEVGQRPTRWELDWVRDGDRWLITQLRELDPISGEQLDRYKKLR